LIHSTHDCWRAQRQNVLSSLWKVCSSLMTYVQLRNPGLMKLTALIEREGDGYVSLCPELDIASQGETIESARDNLREALELFFECASAEEIKQRLRDEIFITHVDVTVA